MKKLVLVSLFLVLPLAFLWAQTITGSINGTILDSQGAAVTKAEIAAINPATDFTRITFPTKQVTIVCHCSPGKLHLRVQAPGFSTVEQKGIILLVGQSLTLNQTLKPGGANEIVEVTRLRPDRNLQFSGCRLGFADRSFHSPHSGSQFLWPGNADSRRASGRRI